MIEASHLTKEFGSIRAIDDVSFSIPRGEIAGFLGPNGAGKTTTMRILAGIFPPTSGRASIAGFDTGTVSEMRSRIRGLQGERTVLLSSHTLSEVSLLCRRVIVINKGRILAEDTPERLSDRLRPSLRVSLRVEAPRDAVVSLLSA